MQMGNMYNSTFVHKIRLKFKYFYGFLIVLLSVLIVACKSNPESDKSEIAIQHDTLTVEEYSNTENIVLIEDTTIVIQKTDSCNTMEEGLSSPLVVLNNNSMESFIRTKLIPLSKRSILKSTTPSIIFINRGFDDTVYITPEIEGALSALQIDLVIRVTLFPECYDYLCMHIKDDTYDTYDVAVIDNMPILIQRDISKTISRSTNEKYVWDMHRFYKNTRPFLILDGGESWYFALIKGNTHYITTNIDYDSFCRRFRVKEEDYRLQLDSIVIHHIERTKLMNEPVITGEGLSADTILNDTLSQSIQF